MFPSDPNDKSLSEIAKFTEKEGSTGRDKYLFPNNAAYFLRNYQSGGINRKNKKMLFE